MSFGARDFLRARPPSELRAQPDAVRATSSSTPKGAICRRPATGRQSPTTESATAAKARRKPPRHDDTDQDDARPAFGRQAGRGETDDDRIVAGQHQVDHDDLEQCGDCVWSEIEQAASWGPISFNQSDIAALQLPEGPGLTQPNGVRAMGQQSEDSHMTATCQSLQPYPATRAHAV